MTKYCTKLKIQMLQKMYNIDVVIQKIKCRAQIPSMGHHTWSYVTSLSLSYLTFTFHNKKPTSRGRQQPGFYDCINMLIQYLPYPTVTGHKTKFTHFSKKKKKKKLIISKGYYNDTSFGYFHVWEKFGIKWVK